jgi:hypothetical protein
MGVKQSVNDVMHVVELDLVQLVRYTSPCVYMLSNSQSRTCLIGHSTNLVVTLGRILEAIRQGSGEYKSLSTDLENVVLTVLETGMSKDELKLKHSNWCYRYYEELGYMSYKDINPLQYQLVEELLPYQGKLLFFVSLVNTRQDRMLVAVFERKKDMKAWISLNYPTPRISAITKQVGIEAYLEGCRQRGSSNRRSSRSKT